MKSKLGNGDYASVSAVLRARIRSLREQDEVIKRWLHNEIAATYDIMKSDPSRAVNVTSASA
ncbi:hypothetical protein [Brucella sp. NBRC 12953]|uniref:hypothetical protein n=1 Tax=Brucella sp. NBRC 12953 TaxID=3075481 RepID=UPI00333F11F7